MRKLLVWLSLLCLGGCVFKQAPAPGVVVLGDQKRILKPFHRIQVDGNFDVDLQTRTRHSAITIQTISQALPYIRTEVSHDTLYVICFQDCLKQPRAQLRIETPRLRSFRYQGSGHITGHLYAPKLSLFINNRGTTVLGGHLGLDRAEISGGGYVTLTGVKSRHLDLVIKNKSKVQLAGNIQLGGMVLENGSWVSLYWLRIDQLTLRAHGHTVIQVAGMARKIDVELWDKAEFRGRYLKADETYVKTHNHSIAEIATMKHQHVLATDTSDIYFYRIPDSKADFMAYDGSVLDMRIFNPKMKYDPYNAFNLS
jgi:hypothetical protein